MKVTEIIKRKGHLFEVRLSDGTYILIDKDIAVKNFVEKDKEFTDKELTLLEEESDFYRCRSRAIYYLSDGDYTEAGIKKKLVTAGFLPDTAQKTVERLKELHLINDERFAENFVKRCNEQNISKRETVEKLIQKGIDRETASYFADDFSSDDNIKIETLLNKKYKDKLNSEKDFEKAVSGLLRKGFKYSDIKQNLIKFTELPGEE